MTDVRQEYGVCGKEWLQNIGQEDGKILSRRLNIGKEAAECR
jgi:hypothetical protein